MDDEEAFDANSDDPPLRVHALFARPPALDNPLLAQVLREEFEHVDMVTAAGGSELRITHPELIGIDDEGDPAWGATLLRPAACPVLGDYSTGQLPDANPGLLLPSDLPHDPGAIEIVEDIPAYAPPQERRAAFAAVVQAVAAATPVLGLAWAQSQMLTLPTQSDPLWGFVGMRRHPAGPEGTLIDTLGMDGLDLPDVWCRFVGLDPDFVAREVGRHARGIYAGTEFIANGDPVAFGDMWFRASWAYGNEPPRRFIALIPDEAHRIGDDPGEAGDFG